MLPLSNLFKQQYLYHYTPKTNLSRIQKDGLTSLYALNNSNPTAYNEAVKIYLDRVSKALKKDKSAITFDDVSEYFRSRDIDTKMIAFSFWRIIPGLHKDRDKFLKSAILVKIPLSKIDSSWKLLSIDGRRVKTIGKSDIKKWIGKDSIPYQKKQGGRFAFSNIPHIAIVPNDGIIPRNKIEIEEKIAELEK